ncbi:NucA/NucB deoxyribonuclease domain-containing protein [Streptomyces huiliensis]|uniref:NucA/NucB deoxyribonuclease domain-containing protein n=1 Tax=Streptomyces huiliensis TaxID=2876027 RepID=UPI001CBBFD41|nr:hypothetical protein [Streptomyces huiliensis]MBZ4318329.1 hypothetical protein [Streptomyces huiliensis]
MAIATLALTASALTTTTASAAAPTKAGAAVAGKGCVPTAPGEVGKEGVGVVDCVTGDGPRDAVPQLTAGPKARVAAPSCKEEDTRHSYCLEANAPYTLKTEKGEIVLTASLHFVTRAAAIDPKAQTWQETISATVTQAAGKGTILFAFGPSCSGQCTMYKAKAWGGKYVPIGVGETKEDFVVYKTTVAKGGQSVVRPIYRGDLTSTEADKRVIPLSTWYGPELRCDKAVGSASGCIVMGHMADVRISIAQYGAAAITYRWAQDNLKGGNTGTKEAPLQRGSDEEDEDAPTTKQKRYQSCDAPPNPFKPILVTTEPDSCDEYPFAASSQGGTNGNLCAEIHPWYNSATFQWEVDKLRYLGPAQTCVRSHVPLKQNTEAGGEYGRAVQSERILDHEWYTVTITP